MCQCLKFLNLKQFESNFKNTYRKTGEVSYPIWKLLLKQWRDIFREFKRLQAWTRDNTEQYECRPLSVLRTGSESMRQKERIYTNALKLSQGWYKPLCAYNIYKD